MLDAANLVRGHAQHAAVDPHALGGRQPGAGLAALVKVQLALA